MSDHIPPTGDELEKWKREAGNQIHFCVTRSEVLHSLQAIVHLSRLLDCITEVERLKQGEVRACEEALAQLKRTARR